MKMQSVKWRPFCLDPNVLKGHSLLTYPVTHFDKVFSTDRNIIVLYSGKHIRQGI